jgi:hypothetical protein
MAAKLKRYVKAASSLFRHEQWNIGIVRAPIHCFLNPNDLPPIEWLASPSSEQYRADPFGVWRDGRLHIFYELFDYKTFRGMLHYVELGNAERSNASTEIIKFPHHASYPYIFEYDGQIFCVPETASANRIALYAAEEFPHKWTYVQTLIPDFSGVDPTIIEFNGLWYLFCGGGCSGHDLYIWYATDPLGTWHPHQMNPVKSGDHHSRPAGTPFTYNKTLYRPAQDGARTYGGGIIIHQIHALSPTEFQERAYCTLKPPNKWLYPEGVHTLSAVGDITLIDAKRYVFSVGGLRYYTKKQLRKLAKRLREKFSGPWGSVARTSHSYQPDNDGHSHSKANSR